MDSMNYMVRNSSLPNPIIFESEEDALECVDVYGGIIHAYRADRDDYYVQTEEEDE